MRRVRLTVPCVAIALSAIACGEDSVRVADQDPGLLAPSAGEEKGRPLANPVVDDAPRETPRDPQADTTGGPGLGSCAADMHSCGSRCVSFSTDARNCGGCAHSCMLGQCSNSQCQSFGFIAGLKNVGNVFADSEHVYWADNGQLFMSNKLGNVVTKLGLTGASSGKVIASDDKAVYFFDTDNNSFGRTSRNELAISTLYSAPMFRGVFRAYHDDFYWAERNESGEDRIMVGSTKGAEAMVAGVATAGVRDIAVDSKHVYWTTTDGRVSRASRFGGCSTTECSESIAREQASPGSITVDAAHVYWANEKTGVVLRANKDSLAIEAFASGRGKPGHVTVDYGGVYFTVQSPNGHTDVVKALLSGDGVIVLGSSNHPIGSLAVDSTALYWTDRTDGMIYKLAK